MTKYKVLFVHKSKLGDSGDAAMFYFPKILANQGHAVSIMAMPGGDSRNFIANSIKVFEIDGKKNWLINVLKTIYKEKPDIVHVFLYSGAGLIPLLAGLAYRPKFVLDIRSPLLRTGLARVLHRIKNWFEPIRFDAITAHGIESSWTQLGKSHDVNFLPPGVDFSLIPYSTKQTVTSDSSSCKLVYIGSLDKLRDPLKMLKAVVYAKETCDIRLDIYGDGSEKQQLQQFVEQQSGADYIFFKGVVSREVLFKKLIDYDLGLAYVPSGAYDAAPALKTLEYLACGLPVLATSTYGNKMFVRQGVNGFLADEISFADQIIEIVNGAKLLAIKGGTRSSVDDFDWKKIVEQRLIPIYKKLLKNKKNEV